MAPSLFALAALVVLAGANVAPLRCPCTRQLEPTCGSDGITYPNACMLKCASRASTSTRGAELRELHPGACAEQKERTQIAAVAEPAHLLCMCRQTRNPVCGTDGVTYNNICSLRCAAGRKAHTKEAELAVAHEGVCSQHAVTAEASISPAHLLCMCRQTVSPVCGTDGVTYTNICSLRCAAGRKAHTKEAELAVAHEGACSSLAASADASPAHLLCMCRQTKNPVCGTDGVTYNNICSLRCAAGRKAHTKEAELAVAHEGACSSHSASADASPAHLLCMCRQTVSPVCGTDGVTYTNICSLRCAAGRKAHTKEAELAVAHEGACSSLAASADASPAHLLCMCRQTKNPVCGTDGVTYNNICSLRCAAGRKAHTKEAELAVAHEGACSQQAVTAEASISPAHLLCMCRQTVSPVCGTDGVTYTNICSLRCAAGRKAHTKEAELAVAHEGACSSHSASADASPAHLLCMCRQTVSPVCGTDGVTYTNICSLRCAAGRKAHTKEAELAVAHEGACVNADKTKGASAAPKTTRLQCMCGPVLSPVCGSDGVTYPNICILKCNAGRRPKAAAELAVAHAGVC